MNLIEVSIIDDKKVPCYIGTSIETRADKDLKIEYRGDNFKAKIFKNTDKIDYSIYENILKQIQK